MIKRIKISKPLLYAAIVILIHNITAAIGWYVLYGLRSEGVNKQIVDNIFLIEALCLLGIVIAVGVLFRWQFFIYACLIYALVRSFFSIIIFSWWETLSILHILIFVFYLLVSLMFSIQVFGTNKNSS